MELEISNLIKILIGVFVLVAVIAGFVFFAKDSVISFFKNLGGGEEVPALFLSLLK